MKAECRQCRMFKPWGGDEGECRKNPPVPVVESRKTGRFKNDSDDALAYWPIVKSWDWCGSFSCGEMMGIETPDD